MKLNELQRKIRNDTRFAEARKEVRKDIAFQVAHLIESLRLSFGLSQSQFAEKIGLQQPAIARMERGTVVPTLPVLQRIANALGCELILPAFVSPHAPVTKTNIQTETRFILSPYQTFGQMTTTEDITRST